VVAVVKKPSGLLKLVDAVVEGEAVFFIGAGFSIDSEGNKASRLVRRLLARFLSLVETVKELDERSHIDRLGNPERLLVHLIANFLPQMADVATVAGFKKLIGDQVHREHTVNEILGSLSLQYYEFNDWCCTTFDKLLDAIPEEEREDLDLSRIDAEWMRRLNSDDPLEADLIPLAPVEMFHFWLADRWEQEANTYAGKALFLDTMGFADIRIMGGTADGNVRGDLLAEYYHGKLFPRHHILARLHREGWINPILTTNYDLLLEGALRLSGFDSSDVDESRACQATYCELDNVVGPISFYQKGQSLNRGGLIKFHGCVQAFRICRKRVQVLTNKKKADQLELEDALSLFCRYLDSMVFTYREIQNWREDSWACDFLRSLLRTRSLVFCGYSLRDPVMHDTFRTVYEEMDRKSRAVKKAYRGRNDSEVRFENIQDFSSEPPAFFIGTENEVPFHAYEVLRSASAAAGDPHRGSFHHEHYLGIQFRDSGNELRGKFPHYDDLFLAIYHLAIRKRQLEAFHIQARRLLSAAMESYERCLSPKKDPPNERELQYLLWRFKERVRLDEKNVDELFAKAGEATDEGERRRRRLREITYWTYGFSAGVMREFAMRFSRRAMFDLGEANLAMGTSNWYVPVHDHPVWSSWAVFLELGIRSVLGGRECTETKGAASQYGACLTPAVFRRPTIFLTAGSRIERSLHSRALMIRANSSTVGHHDASLPGNPFDICVWRLPMNERHDWYSAQEERDLRKKHQAIQPEKPRSRARWAPPAYELWQEVVRKPHEPSPLTSWLSWTAEESEMETV